MGCLSAAGIGVAETKQCFFEDHVPDVLENEVCEFLKLRLREDWLNRFDFPPDGIRPTLFALVAIDEALASAGLRAEDLEGLRVGICLGSTVGGANYQPAFNEAYFLGRKPDPRALFDYLHNNSTQVVAHCLGWRGPRLLINNACTSGADAIGIGSQWLNAGLCDIAVCGGIEAVLPKIFLGFRSLQLCSPERCTPFDQHRRGLTLGEGAGIVILEKPGSSVLLSRFSRDTDRQPMPFTRRRRTRKRAAWDTP